MPKNLVKNHFETAGIYVNGERSTFRFNKPVLDSFMSGMLVPLGDPIPVFPGKKLDLSLDAVIRSNTMVVPPLDGISVDFFGVWVPHRIVWNHMPQFLGEPEETAWTQVSSYFYPYVNFGTVAKLGYHLGFYASNESLNFVTDVLLGNFSLFAHYGLMTNYENYNNLSGSALSLKINMLAARGYYSIWNYLFRDENYQRPVLFSKGDTGSDGEFGYVIRDFVLDANEDLFSEIHDGYEEFVVGKPDTAILMPVNKLHDAFTSLLPQAQFGDPVELSFATTAPVIADSSVHTIGDIKLYNSAAPTASYNLAQNNGVLSTYATSPTGETAKINRTNLVADLTTSTATSINQIRTSVMYQRYLEALARGGRRMVEYYSSIYQVKNTSAKCDYPELLSRSRYMLNVNQVVATADSSDLGWTSHLGDTGAYSLTALRNIPICEKDFTEFGYLHILYCVRADNRWSTMIQPHFLRSDILSEYNPFFDHIGDVEVPNFVVNFMAGSKKNFGFQEAWWDERTQLSMANCALNKNYGSLRQWILGEAFDQYTTVCTPGFLTFNPSILDDIFVSAHYVYPQFIIDGRIHGVSVARMSQHSTPGIVGRI